MRALVLLTALGAATASYAEPYLAVRTGEKCMACHVNPTGGGKRTEAGARCGQIQMPARRLDLKTGALVDGGDAGTTPWTGAINDHLALGGDLRSGLEGRNAQTGADTSAFNTRAQVYVEVKPIVDRLTVYLDERVAPGTATTREAYGMLWLGERTAYLKAGRLFVPFGLRIEDDTAFIRQASGTTFSSSDDGVEGGLELGPWSAALAVTNGAGGGAETNRSKQVSGLASYVRQSWRVGASASTNSSETADRRMQSLFAGLRTGIVSWLASAVRVTDEAQTMGRVQQYASLVEGNLAVAKGHNVKLTYEYLDPNRTVREDQRERYSAVWEYTPFQFTQLRAGLRKNQGIPQNAAQNGTDLFLQWHAFF